MRSSVWVCGKQTGLLFEQRRFTSISQSSEALNVLAEITQLLTSLNTLPEIQQPSTLQIKSFSLCLFFWSTLYTVSFDHAYRRLPRHQSTVWARTQCPTETWAEIYLFDWGLSDLIFCLLFAPLGLPPVHQIHAQPWLLTAHLAQGAPPAWLKSASSWGRSGRLPRYCHYWVWWFVFIGCLAV